VPSSVAHPSSHCEKENGQESQGNAAIHAQGGQDEEGQPGHVEGDEASVGPVVAEERFLEDAALQAFDVEFCCVGDGHDGHYPCLNWVGNDEVCGIGNAACHV
jgi:hypothetical protein